MEELLKMLANKKHGEMSDDETQAKLDVIKELLGMADGEMGKHVKMGMDGMKKVTVAAPDSEGLAAGLDKAEDMVGSEDEEENPTETDEADTEDSSATDAMDHVTAEPEDDDMNPFMKKRRMMGMK